MKYPLATETWTDEEKNSAKSVIDSGMCTMGPITKEFEDKFSKHFGSKYSVFVNSGSSANLLAVAAMRYRKGSALGTVIVPAVSWSTTYYPIHQLGYKLAFIDVSLQDFNMQVDTIKNAINDIDDVVGVMAVNLLGMPCHLQEIKNLCDENHIFLIEDNCESMGATYNGKYAGTFGDIGTFSTFFSHHICTVEGGVCVTDDEELYHLMISLRSHGWIRNLPEKNHVFDKSGNYFEDSFKFVLPGYNIRGNDIFAAIGLKQLDKLDNIINNRINNYFTLIRNADNSIFGESTLLNIQNYTIPSQQSSWFGFGFICKNNRDEIVNKLLQNGIECRPIVAGNFLKNPVIKHLDHIVYGDINNADIIDKNGFFIGNNGEDLSEEIKYFWSILGE